MDVCFRCGAPAIGTCERCGQAYCARHGGGICAECVANLRTERALAVSLNSCLAGLVIGLIVVGLLALLAPGVMRGTGVAIGIILATGALVTVLGYAAIIVGGRHL